MITRTIGKTVKLQDACGPAPVAIEPPPFPPEEIVAAVQIVALSNGQLFIQAPQDIQMTNNLLIEGLIETRKRHQQLVEQQQAKGENTLIAFPRGVTPR